MKLCSASLTVLSVKFNAQQIWEDDWDEEWSGRDR